jgi:hypothetical protein
MVIPGITARGLGAAAVFPADKNSAATITGTESNKRPPSNVTRIPKTMRPVR